MNETVKPPVSEVVKPIEVSSSRKIRVDLKKSKSKESTISKDKMHGKPAWVSLLWEVWTHSPKLLQVANC